jgi:proteic killer suppression protein
LKIVFTDKKLQEACQNFRIMQKKFGKLAPKLRTRLADLDAASNVLELVAGRPHALSHDRKGQYAVDLDNMIRLIFEAANDPVPRCLDGSVDWKKVTMIRIVEIGDYHDK